MGRQCSPAAAVRAASAPLSSCGLALPIVQSRLEALPKEKRLAKRREFLRVYETGRKIFSRYCVLFFAANQLPHSRVGVTATKKVGKANVRNRLKRWTREIYRRQRELLAIDQKTVDVVINVKPSAVDADFGEYQSDLQRALRKIAEA
jgi:ribonuclease P protein component